MTLKDQLKKLQREDAKAIALEEKRAKKKQAALEEKRVREGKAVATKRFKNVISCIDSWILSNYEKGELYYHTRHRLWGYRISEFGKTIKENEKIWLDFVIEFKSSDLIAHYKKEDLNITINVEKVGNEDGSSGSDGYPRFDGPAINDYALRIKW